jgi:hypothetical protein
MLKTQYEKAEDIPEAMKEFFKEVDGKHILQAEGLKTQTDVDKIQDALRKEREDHASAKAKAKEAANALATANDKIEILEKNGGDDDDREPTNAERLELAQLRRDVKTLAEDRDNYKTDFEGLSGEVTANTIKDVLRKQFPAHINKDALEREIDFAVDKFTVSEGKVLTKAELGANGGLTPEEFAASVVKANSYLGIESNSGGATGGSGKGSQNDDSEDTAENAFKEVLGG